MSFYESGKFKVYVVRKDKPTPTSTLDFIEYNDYFDECTIEGGISSLGALFATFSGRITTPSPKGDSGTLGSDLTEGNFIYILLSDGLAIKARITTATFSLEGKIEIEGIQSCGLRQGVNLDKDEYGGSEFNNTMLGDIFTSTVWNARGVLVDDSNAQIVHDDIAESTNRITLKLSPQKRLSAITEVLKNNGYEWGMTHGSISSAVPFSGGDTLKTSVDYNVQSAGTVLDTLYLSGENNNCIPSKNSEKDVSVVNDVVIKGFDKQNTPLTSNIYHSTDTHRTTTRQDLDAFLKEDMPAYNSSDSSSTICYLTGTDAEKPIVSGYSYLFKIDNEYMVGEYDSSSVAFINVIRGQTHTTTRTSDITVCKNSTAHSAGKDVIILAEIDLVSSVAGVYARYIGVDDHSGIDVDSYVFLGSEKVWVYGKTTSGSDALIIIRSLFPDEKSPGLFYLDKFSDEIYAHTSGIYVWDAQYTKYSPEPYPDTNSISQNGLQTKVYYAKSNYSKDELDKLAIRILDALDNNISNYVLDVTDAANNAEKYAVGKKINVSDGAFLGISDGTYRIINRTIKLPENTISLELANEDYRAYASDSSDFSLVKEKTGEPWEFLTGFTAKHVRTEGETTQIAGKPIFKWKNDGEGRFSTNYVNSEEAWDYFGTPAADREFEDYDSEIATVGYVKAATGGSGPGGLWTEDTTNLYPYTDRNILPFTTDLSTLGSSTKYWTRIFTNNTNYSADYSMGISPSSGKLAFTKDGGTSWIDLSEYPDVWEIQGYYSDSLTYRPDLNLYLVNRTSDPTHTGDGMLYYNASDNSFRGYCGSTKGWVDLSSEGLWRNYDAQSIEPIDDKLIKLSYFYDSFVFPTPTTGVLYHNNSDIKWYSGTGWEILNIFKSDSTNIYPTIPGHFIPYSAGANLGGTIANDIWEDINYYGLLNTRDSSGNLLSTLGGGAANLYVDFMSNKPLYIRWNQSDSSAWERQLYFSGNAIYPAGTNQVNLGNSSKYFANTYTISLNAEDVNYYGLSNSRTSSGTLVGSIGADSTDAFWQINGILGVKLNWAQSGTGTSDRQLWFLGDSIYPNTNNTVNLGAPTRYFENTYTTLLNSNEVDSVFGEFSGSGSTPALKAGEYSSGDFNLEVTTSTFRLYNSMLDFHYDNPFKQIQFSTSSFGTYSAIRANPYTNVLEFTNDGSTWEEIESARAPLWQYTSSGVQPVLSGRHVVPNGSGSDLGIASSGDMWRNLYTYNSINLCDSATSPTSLLKMHHSGNTSYLTAGYDLNLRWGDYTGTNTLYFNGNIIRPIVDDTIDLGHPSYKFNQLNVTTVYPDVIKSINSFNLYWNYSYSSNFRLYFSGSTIMPAVTNYLNLGDSSHRFNSLHVSSINLNGTTKTSWPTSEWVGTATSNLNMGAWGIYLGGVYRTSWPSAGMQNPATSDLNMNFYDIDNVDYIKGTTGYSYLRLGTNMYVESDQDMYISSISGPMEIDCHSTLTMKWTQHSSSADEYKLFFSYGAIYPEYSFDSCYGTVSLGKSSNRFDYSWFYGLAARWFDTSSCDVAELQFVANDVNIGDIVELGEWDDCEEQEFEKEVAHNDETCDLCGTSYLGMQGKWKKAAKRSRKCPSIVSTEPGMLLGGSENRKKLYASGKMKPIALKGSVPMVYIEGSFKSGDILVSAGNGHAMVDNDANWNEVVAYAKRSGENERCEVWVK